MTTKTGASTSDPSTKSATGKRRRTKPSGDTDAPEPGDLDFDLHAAGGRVVSVFGAFNSRVLIELPTSKAVQLFPGPLEGSSPTHLVESVERDLADLRKRSAPLADSALAASALAMALEIENPYNSSTSKSMCARVLIDTMDSLRELAPSEEKKDGLDDLASRRAARIAR